MRQLAHAVERDDDHARRRERDGGVEQNAVPGFVLQASADGEDSHGHLLVVAGALIVPTMSG